MTTYIKRHMLERSRGRPIGTRQARILAVAQREAASGLPFPSLSRIASELGLDQRHRDIACSIIGLAARGLVEVRSVVRDSQGRPTRTFALTAAGHRHRAQRHP